MKSLLSQVKTQVTARKAAKRYGVFINRSGVACCFCHNDCHPSMKIPAELDERKAMMDYVRQSNAVTKMERILNEEQREAKNNVRSEERTA